MEGPSEPPGSRAPPNLTLTLDCLPSDPLLHILSYLSYKDLATCCQVCHKLKDLTSNNCLWKRPCRIYWGITECPADISWRDQFLAWYHNFGQYFTVYMAVRRAWNQIEGYMQTHCPKIYQTITDGASEQELDDAESRLGRKLPAALRCIYRVHNGQASGDTYGLLGGIENYDHRRSEQMLPLNDVVDLWKLGVEQYCLPEQFVPLTFCRNSHTMQYVLCGEDPIQDLAPGTVFYTTRANSNQDLFVSGSNCLDWFCKYGQELEDDRFARDGENILKFYQDPTAVAVTEQLRVSVATAFIPEMSRITHKPTQLVHAYRVTLSMDAQVRPSATCQLETRHWKITDESGIEESVNGPGVIGEHPIIGPGVTWSYISCTHFKTDKGTMRGTYTMRNIATGEKFDAEVPTFHMKTAPYVILPKEFTKKWKI
jgi:F-box protein 3